MSTYPGGSSGSNETYKPYEDAAVNEQRNIAASLGPCPKGGDHELRLHYTSGTLFWAFCLGLPRFCGYAKRKTVCTKCNQEFKGVSIPEAGTMK
ncbi:14651_t:CDS:2 [Funneliformis caledonium]|uniref:14651_t:CDS:1 n=1 Tax=Funneliformis caledonium TaxID=1117310 RepID=A0A9N9HKV1_9GLOM|nr:14651_t:CDS:2 [Funneliformis caledonium]